jgi:NDP-4-keto-2,6-dideoxyhexose 3-C-methyltransferase
MKQESIPEPISAPHVGRAVRRCRICGSGDLIGVLDLGVQAFTGVFPRSDDEAVPYGPLQLVKCSAESGGCGLVQLRHAFEAADMYGDNYGYRSGLNRSMVRHLQHRVMEARRRVDLSPGDVVLDIGSNDATALRCYGDAGYRLVGIDPSAAKFQRHYPKWVECVPDFFSARLFHGRVGDARARIVTSIAMFYDLEDPTAFMRQVHDVLADDGIWVFEQSYLPLMIERNAYDTVCHEHVSYYALRQIKWMADRVGLRLLDVEFNDVNGGSFCVTAARRDSPHRADERKIEAILEDEDRLGYGEQWPYERFRRRVVRHRDELRSLIRGIGARGGLVCGYGASTKGNVVLQYCGFTSDDIPMIAEVNDDKFGCVTPHTRIPIVPESEVRAARPDALLVLPWHFRDGIVAREQAYLAAGGSLLFPLPRIESVAVERELRRAA